MKVMASLLPSLLILPEKTSAALPGFCYHCIVVVIFLIVTGQRMEVGKTADIALEVDYTPLVEAVEVGMKLH